MSDHKDNKDNKNNKKTKHNDWIWICLLLWFLCYLLMYKL